MVKSTVRHVRKLKNICVLLNSSIMLLFLSLKVIFFIALSTDGVSLMITFAAIHVSQGITYFLRPGS